MRTFDRNQVPKPAVDFQFSCLPSHGRIDLEIGAGQGLHAIQYAQTNPDRHLIAVEKTHTRFHKLEGRKNNHPEISNLSCVQADAVSFVTHLVPEASLDRVFLLYPNPYAKNSQANLRWHNRPFLSELISKMKPGSKLELATNILSYHLEAQESLTRGWGLELIEARQVNPAINTPRTHFEIKYLKRKETCWNLILRKPAIALA